MTERARERVPDEEDLLRLADDEILALVQTRSRQFQRRIRSRDWLEVGVSAVVAVTIAPAVVRGAPLVRIGATMILAGLAVIAFRLWRARRVGHGRASDVALPVAAALRAEVERVDAQIRLLATVAWWYVAPIMIGSLVMVGGQNGRSGWLKTLAYAIFAALVSWGIIAVNHRAVRKTLQPKRDELLGLLTRLES